MKNAKKVAVWVAATPNDMDALQRGYCYENGDLTDLPACGVQEDVTRDSTTLDEEAFLQAYIEGVAMVMYQHIMDQRDQRYTSPCQHIVWPSLWMTKIVDTVKGAGNEFDIDQLFEEGIAGVHFVTVAPKQFVFQATTQICVPVSIGAIQAGLAYLKISVHESMEEIHREIYMTKDEAYRILESFREHQRHMLTNLLHLPRFDSVISRNAIHL